MDGSGAPVRTDAAFLRRVLLVASVVVLALLLWAWRHVLLLIFGAVLIAIGLHALADPIARRTPLSRGGALACAAVLLVSILAGLGWLFGSQIGTQISEVILRLPSAWAELRAQAAASPLGATLLDRFEAWGAGESVNGAVAGAFQRLGGFTMSFASGALNALLVVFAAAFFALDPKPYRRGLLLLFPKEHRPEVEGVLDDSQRALRKWLGATLISMTSVATMVGVGLWVLKVPAFAALALLAGLAQFLPVVGPIFAAAPAVLLAVTVSPQTALWTVGLYVVASQLEANVIYPIVQKRAVSLPPALTLFAIIAVGLLLGPLGVLFAVPLTVLASILITRLYVNRTLGERVTAPGAD